MFQPPRCPNRHCTQHRQPTHRFFIRKGYYHPSCRPRAVPRFRCRSCGLGFSRQTFRADYRDHRPDLNTRVFLSLATGLGLRQTARNVGLTLRCTELKFRKIARHLRRLNLNLRRSLEAPDMQFDELETYEGRRNTRPLSLPILIDRESRFVIWGESAPIRPRGKMSKSRELAIREDERDAAAWSRSMRRQRAGLPPHGREVDLSTSGRAGLWREEGLACEDEQSVGSHDLEPAVPDQSHRGDDA
jgi:transposase-like protein